MLNLENQSANIGKLYDNKSQENANDNIKNYLIGKKKVGKEFDR